MQAAMFPRLTSALGKIVSKWLTVGGGISDA